MSRTFGAYRTRMHLRYIFLPFLLLMLSSCSFFGLGASPAKPAVWTSYRGQAFSMSYFSNWELATKDLYLGTSYPQLEMLQGMVFSDQGSATTFVQVVYADNVGGSASVSDLLCKYVLGTLKQPLAPSSLTTTTLAGETWSQGSVEKQVSSTGAPGGSMLAVKEAALGVSYTVNAHQTKVYLIIYQDASGTFNTTNHNFFTRMLNSFHF
jgi:hypothetical protein